MKANQEVIAVILVKGDGGLKQDGSIEGGEQWVVSKCACTVLPMGLAYGLNVDAEE